MPHTPAPCPSTTPVVCANGAAASPVVGACEPSPLSALPTPVACAPCALCPVPCAPTRGRNTQALPPVRCPRPRFRCHIRQQNMTLGDLRTNLAKGLYFRPGWADNHVNATDHQHSPKPSRGDGRRGGGSEQEPPARRQRRKRTVGRLGPGEPERHHKQEGKVRPLVDSRTGAAQISSRTQHLASNRLVTGRAENSSRGKAGGGGAAAGCLRSETRRYLPSESAGKPKTTWNWEKEFPLAPRN